MYQWLLNKIAPSRKFLATKKSAYKGEDCYKSLAQQLKLICLFSLKLPVGYPSSYIARSVSRLCWSLPFPPEHNHRQVGITCTIANSLPSRNPIRTGITHRQIRSLQLDKLLIMAKCPRVLPHLQRIPCRNRGNYSNPRLITLIKSWSSSMSQKLLQPIWTLEWSYAIESKTTCWTIKICSMFKRTGSTNNHEQDNHPYMMQNGINVECSQQPEQLHSVDYHGKSQCLSLHQDLFSKLQISPLSE